MPAVRRVRRLRKSIAVNKHILFPFDGSQQGIQGAPFVCALAAALDARVSIVHQ
jgi:hypothetical protein